MAEAAAIASVHGALIQPQHDLYFAPVRHHSPACAWAVRALIREVRPKAVLVEAPEDFTPHIDLLAQAETKPPVAIVALVNEGKGHRVAAYYPFCVHAPEYVAVREGRAIGAAVRFIDLPAASKAMLRVSDDTTPISLNDEAVFDSGEFVRSLCRRTGCRDGYELWDHLFEARLGDADWRTLLADIGAYCAGIRAATPAGRIERNGDLAREAHMSVAIIDAIAAGGPVVVVTGGFHTPALIDAVARREASRAKEPPTASRSFLIRYGFAALDALNGYGAGLPQPFYYDFLWRRVNDGGGVPVWQATALDLASEFTRKMRAQGHSISVPQQVEMVRVAEALARMRGRPGASRHDLIDAARTALIKGEAGRRDVWTERLLEFLRGDAIGDVPASAGSPPLVEHARSLARTHRIDISDGARRRRQLDIRRKPAHLAASRYFHAMTLLGTNFANRDAGPDYLGNTQMELLFEEWSYAWSPTVEGRLIELAAQADRVDTACLAVLRSARDALRASGAGADIAAIVDLVAQGLLAGLGHGLIDIVTDLGADIQAHADFTSVALALRRLYHISSSGGPLRAPAELDLKGVTVAAYQRLVYLCDDLPNTRADAAGARVDALRIMAELLNSDEAGVFDRSLFDDAIDRVAEANPPAEILGAVLAICVQAGRRTADDLGAALSGRFAGSVQEEHERLDALKGMLQAAPQLLWRTPGILEVIDGFLGGLDEASFLALLPHMRLAFSALNPREIDLVAARLAQLLGGSASSFAGAHHSLSQADFERGLALDKDLRAAAARDGLDAWLLGEARS